MIEPTDTQVAALALPGETWEAARQRTLRLLRAVKQCVPCRHCDPEDMARFHFAPGWVDETTAWADCCPVCTANTYDDGEPFELDDEYNRKEPAP